MSSHIGNVAVRQRAGRKAAKHVCGEIQEFLALWVAYGFRSLKLEQFIHPKNRRDHTYERVEIEFTRMDETDHTKGICLKVTAFSEAWDGKNRKGEQVGNARAASKLALKLKPNQSLILGVSSKDKTKPAWRTLDLSLDDFSDQKPWGKVFDQLLRTVKSCMLNVQRVLFARGARDMLWEKISARGRGRGGKGGGKGKSKAEGESKKDPAPAQPKEDKKKSNGSAKKPASATKPKASTKKGNSNGASPEAVAAAAAALANKHNRVQPTAN